MQDYRNNWDRVIDLLIFVFGIILGLVINKLLKL